MVGMQEHFRIGCRTSTGPPDLACRHSDGKGFGLGSALALRVWVLALGSGQWLRPTKLRGQSVGKPAGS